MKYPKGLEVVIRRHLLFYSVKSSFITLTMNTVATTSNNLFIAKSDFMSCSAQDYENSGELKGLLG